MIPHAEPKCLLLAALLCLAAVPSADSETPDDVGAVPERDKISVTLVDSDIRDALRMVAAQGDVNVVMSKSVQGRITLDLDEVSLEESLDAIVTVGGFQYAVDGDIVTISTLTERREQAELERELAGPPPGPEVPEVLLLELRHVDAERVEPVIKNLLSEEGTVTLLDTSDHVAQRYDPGGGPAGEGQLQLGSQLTSSSMGRPAKSHTLVVMDVPSRLARIREVVDEVDQMPPSVVIETRFVEISLDDEDRMGFDWNVVAGMTGANAPTTFPLGDSSLGSFNPNVSSGSPNGGVFPGAPDSVTTPGMDGLFTFGSLDFSTFTAVLELIQQDSRVEMVSNPRIVVNDRHTATILVGERYPILSANVTEFGAVIEQLDRYEPVGVQLVVTPSVVADDEIELFVRPTSSSIGSIVEGSSGIQVARINSRQIDTAVTVKDGQTVVLGGLITSRESQVERSVPVLGSVPLLGGLFRYEATRVERVDLVVFLTVRIVRSRGLSEAQRRLFERTTLDDEGGATAAGPRTELEFLVSSPLF